MRRSVWLAAGISLVAAAVGLFLASRQHPGPGPVEVEPPGGEVAAGVRDADLLDEPDPGDEPDPTDKPAPPAPDPVGWSIEEAIDRLDDEHDLTRALAFRELAVRGERAQAALPALRALLEDPNDRFAAALALCLVDPDKYDQHLARAVANGRSSVPFGWERRGLRPLMSAAAAPGLDAQDAGRRKAAFELLGIRGCRPGDPAYPVFVKALRDPGYPERGRARRFLLDAFVLGPNTVSLNNNWVGYRAGRAGPEALPDDVRAWSQLTPAQVAELSPLLTDQDLELRALVAAVLVMAGEFETALPVVLAYPWPLANYDDFAAPDQGLWKQWPSYIPRIIRARLREMPAAARPRVRAIAAAALRGGASAEEKKAAIQALWAAGNTDPAVLRPAFEDPDERVRRFVVNQVLAEQSPPGAIPQVMDYLARHPDGSLTARLADWLQIIDPLPPEAIEFIAGTLFSADGKPAYPVAVSRLPTAGPGAGRTAELVVRYLGSGDRDLPPAFGAVAVLAGELGPAAKPAVPALRRGLKNRPVWDVVRAADALLRVVPGDSEAVAALLAVLGSSDPEAYNAAYSLGRLGELGKPIVPKLIRMAEGCLPPGGASVGPSAVAVQVLGDLGPCARDALPVLRRCMDLQAADQGTADVVVDAALAVGRIDPAEASAAVTRLTTVLANGRMSGQSSRKAAAALCRLGPAARPAVPELIAYARFDPTAVGWIAVGVARIAPDRHAEMLDLLAEGWGRFGDVPSGLSYPSLGFFAVESLDHSDRAVRIAAWNLLAATGIPPQYQARLRALVAKNPNRHPGRLLEVALAREGGRIPPSPEILGEVKAWERKYRRRTLPARIAQLARPQLVDPIRSIGREWELVAETDRASLRKNLPDLLRAVDQAGAGDADQDPFGAAERYQIRALARAAPDCVGPLAERLGAGRPVTVRACAALALKAAGKEAAAAVPGLRRALGDPDAWVRLLAAEALCAVETPPPAEAVLALAELARAPTQDARVPLAHLLNAAHGTPVWAHGRALEVLRDLGPAAKPAADLLAKQLGDKSSWWFAEHLIGADPARAPELVRVLIGQLEERRASPDPLTRGTVSGLTAYKTLDRIPRSARPAGPVLAGALARHPDDELTAVLARALRRVDPAAAKAAGVR